MRLSRYPIMAEARPSPLFGGARAVVREALGWREHMTRAPHTGMSPTEEA